MSSNVQRIVVLGGGFAGVYAARRLEKIFSRDERVEITLLSDENYLLFTPMLPGVPSSSIEAKHIISPLRAFFRKTKFQNRQVRCIDLQRRFVVAAHCPGCAERTIEFDHLILALGSTTYFRDLPGVEDHALPMRTLGDAMRLRNHVIGLLEHADMQTDAVVRGRMLTFVVAGGGFAGTEAAAELHDFAYTVRGYYPNIRPEEVRVILVHAGPRIMPEIGKELAAYATGKLRRKGIEIFLDTRVHSAGPGWVKFTDGRIIHCDTLVWTAGVAPNPLTADLPCDRNSQGRIIVNEFLAAPGFPRVWAVGDCAAVTDPATGQFCAPTAQQAIRQGKTVAENVAASIRGAGWKTFRYSPLGTLASLGRRSAVAEIRGVKFSGFFAWWLWRTLYLLKLPGLERKIRVAMDWTLDLFFPRDIVLLRVFGNKPQETIAAAKARREAPVAADFVQERGLPR